MSQSAPCSTIGAKAPMVWVIELGKQLPQKRLMVLGIALAAAAIGLLMFRSPLFALIGFGAVMFSTAELFMPVHYRLDLKGAHAKCGLSVTSLDWVNLRRLERQGQAILLSPLPKSSRLDAFRGVFLRTDGNLDEVFATICELTGRNDFTLGTGHDGRGRDAVDQSTLL